MDKILFCFIHLFCCPTKGSKVSKEHSLTCIVCSVWPVAWMTELGAGWMTDWTCTGWLGIETCTTDMGVGLAEARSVACVTTSEFSFTSKLVDGRFPDYRRVLPRNGDKVFETNKDALRQVLSRASILSNEKFKGVRLNFSESNLKITANNPEQEQAEEEIEIHFPYGDLEIGFNVSYVLDVLSAIKDEQVKFTLADANSSVVIEGSNNGEALYVVMPMRL